MAKDEENRAQSPEEQLIEAKINFINATEAYDPLAIIKKHPWISVGSAFAAGIGAATSKIDLKNLSLAPLILQIGNYLLKYLIDAKRP